MTHISYFHPSSFPRQLTFVWFVHKLLQTAARLVVERDADRFEARVARLHVCRHGECNVVLRSGTVGQNDHGCELSSDILFILYWSGIECVLQGYSKCGLRSRPPKGSQWTTIDCQSVLIKRKKWGLWTPEVSKNCLMWTPEQKVLSTSGVWDDE